MPKKDDINTHPPPFLLLYRPTMHKKVKDCIDLTHIQQEIKASEQTHTVHKIVLLKLYSVLDNKKSNMVGIYMYLVMTHFTLDAGLMHKRLCLSFTTDPFY